MVSADELSENPDWTTGVAERKIQEAMEEGLFDNLPGAGKPIDLSVNPFEQPGMGAVNRLLKNNNVLPTWALLEKEIEALREKALAVLARWEQTEPHLRDRPEYEPRRAATRALYESHLRQTNDLILSYNLSNPFVYRAPVPFQIKVRLREFDERYGTAT